MQDPAITPDLIEGPMGLTPDGISRDPAAILEPRAEFHRNWASSSRHLERNMFLQILQRTWLRPCPPPAPSVILRAR